MFQKITRNRLEAFLRRYASNKRALDIGSGNSSYDTYFPNRVTIDIDSARNPDVIGDAHQLPFNDAEFELVLSTEMLEHVKDPGKVVSEMHRVLKPGGMLILTTRFVYPLHDTPHDYWRFTKYGLQLLFKDWEIIECLGDTKSFSTIGVLLQRIAFQSTLRPNKIAKLMLFVLAWAFDHSNGLMVREFGDIAKKSKEQDIMPSGYFLVCKSK